LVVDHLEIHFMMTTEGQNITVIVHLHSKERGNFVLL